MIFTILVLNVNVEWANFWIFCFWYVGDISSFLCRSRFTFIRIPLWAVDKLYNSAKISTELNCSWFRVTWINHQLVSWSLINVRIYCTSDKRPNKLTGVGHSPVLILMSYPWYLSSPWYVSWKLATLLQFTTNVFTILWLYRGIDS